MSKRSSKPRASKRAIATTTAAAVPTATLTSDALSVRAIVTDLPDDHRVPECIAAYVTGFRAIARLPVTTTAERVAASRAFAAAAFPNGEFAVPSRDAGGSANACRSDIGTGIMDVQNAVYVAMACANVRLHVGHVSAAWAAIFPNARCGSRDADYTGVPYVTAARYDYPFAGTLSAFLNANNGHAGTGTIPGSRTAITALRANIRGNWFTPASDTPTA